MESPMTLLGVVHRDPEGAGRLAQALRGLDFAMISVEVSAYALAWRRREGYRLLGEMEAHLPTVAREQGLDLTVAQAHPALAWLRAYLALPYEWTVSLGAAQGRPCLAIDRSAISRDLLAQASLLVSPENLAALLSGPPPPGAESERRRAADLLSGRGGWPKPDPPDPDREAILALRLRRLQRACISRGGSLVHVGGWRHLIPGQSPPSLADRLGLPLSRRVLA